MLSKQNFLLILYVNLSLYALAFWIQTNTLPFLTKKLGADAELFGYLQTAFSLVQTAGSPVYGYFGDTSGSRLVLLVASAGSIVGYAILASSVNLVMVFLSRLPSIVQHVMQGTQMMIVEASSLEERPAALAKLPIAYGVGMVIGPSLGGYLQASVGELGAAWVSCLVSVLSLGLLFFLPSDGKQYNSSKEMQSTDGDEGEEQTKGFFASLALLKNAQIRNLLTLKAILGFPAAALQSMLSLLCADFLNIPVQEIGLIQSVAAVSVAVSQALLLAPLKKRFGPSKSVVCCVALLLVSFIPFILGPVGNVKPSIWIGCVFIPMAASGTIVSTLLTAQITHLASSQSGLALGLDMSVGSAVRVVSPAIGGRLLTQFGLSSFGWLGVSAYALILLMVPVWQNLFVTANDKAKKE